MGKQDFPVATKVSPVYRIDGALYTRATSKEAMDNSEAIRARVESADGTAKVAWFLPALACCEPEGGDEQVADEEQQQAPKIAG